MTLSVTVSAQVVIRSPVDCEVVGDPWTPNTFISEDGTFQVVNITYLCKYVSGTPTNVEADKCLWVGWMDWKSIHEQRRMGNLFKPLEMLIDRMFSDHR